MGGIVDAVFGGNETPDPYQTANAQGAMNAETARITTKLNRPDQVTPYGTQTWENLGGDRWKSSITLSPEQQALLDQQNKINLGLGGAQQSALDRVQSTFSSGLDTSSLSPRLSPERAVDASTVGVYDPSRLYSGAEGLAGAANGYLNKSLRDTSAPLQHVASTASADAPTVSAGGGVAYNAPSGAMPNSNEAYRKQIQDALYGQYTSRLDPRFQQQESDMQSRLAAQGITQGSTAYDREVQNFGRERTDAYDQAMRDAVAQGESAVAGQFGRDMSGRQQTATEEQARVNAALTGRGQDLQASVAQASADQAQQALRFNQSLADANLGLSQRQVNNSQISQALQAALAGQTGIGQAAELGLTTAKTIPQAAADYTKLYGDERTAGFNEQTAMRNQVLNELNAVRNGTQAQTPQFQSGQSGATVENANLSDNVWNSYKAQTAKNTSLFNDIASIGSMIMGF